MKKSDRKMDEEELQVWLHVNRKAHAIQSKKNYSRKTKHKRKEIEYDN